MRGASRINVLGVGISDINHATALELIREAIADGRKGYVTVTGVHGVSECQTDEELRRVHNESFLTTPDGMPMVWMGKLAGSQLIERVYGPDMMLNVLGEGIDRGWRHFFFGGGEGVAEKLKIRLEDRFPGVQIVGTFTPPFRPLNEAEESDLERRVAEAKPHCFWVGLSTPKQERFMARYLPRLDTTLMFGVGAAFDFHAGLVPQAPRWMQQAGLEWLYRLAKEPKRLWKRYFKNNPLFIGRVLLQKIGLRRYPPVPNEFPERDNP
jgi:N-acetylglucosaminyldiphosphoundecaprenol N-acetyl-beta-D-mannosaminyltransferase